MKTDTDDTIRVTVTFRRESHPEWYDTLIGIRSGRSRAEIVRSALALPRARPASRPVSLSASPAATAVPDSDISAAPRLKPAKDRSKATVVKGSDERGVADGLLTNGDAKNKPNQQPTQEPAQHPADNSADNAPPETIRRGGMAAELLDMGL